METRNELKTLEEANYREQEFQKCSWCIWVGDEDDYTGLCRGMKFEKTVFVDGVCDCYE